MRPERSHVAQLGVGDVRRLQPRDDFAAPGNSREIQRRDRLLLPRLLYLVDQRLALGGRVDGDRVAAHFAVALLFDGQASGWSWGRYRLKTSTPIHQHAAGVVHRDLKCGNVLLDAQGNDTYRCYQYGQGAGIHLSVGILADWQGDDQYSDGNIVQGTAHDWSVGMLFDVRVLPQVHKALQVTMVLQA